MRSWLIAPADNETALGALAAAGADAVVIDLARTLGSDVHTQARLAARDWIAIQRQQVLAQRRFARWVRIGGIGGPNWREDLQFVMQAEPDGIMLADIESAAHVQQLAATVYEIEQRRGIAHGSTQIMPQLGSSARAALAIGEFAGELPARVSGFAWDAAALALSLGAKRTRGSGGAWCDAMAYVRAQVLLVANAHGLAAIETPYRDVRDTKGGRFAAEAARADGFAGMMAIHPAQVAAINEAYSATRRESAEAD